MPVICERGLATYRIIRTWVVFGGGGTRDSDNETGCALWIRTTRVFCIGDVSATGELSCFLSIVDSVSSADLSAANTRKPSGDISRGRHSAAISDLRARRWEVSHEHIFARFDVAFVWFLRWQTHFQRCYWIDQVCSGIPTTIQNSDTLQAQFEILVALSFAPQSGILKFDCPIRDRDHVVWLKCPALQFVMRTIALRKIVAEGTVYSVQELVEKVQFGM